MAIYSRHYVRLTMAARAKAVAGLEFQGADPARS